MDNFNTAYIICLEDENSPICIFKEKESVIKFIKSHSSDCHNTNYNINYFMEHGYLSMNTGYEISSILCDF